MARISRHDGCWRQLAAAQAPLYACLSKKLPWREMNLTLLSLFDVRGHIVAVFVCWAAGKGLVVDLVNEDGAVPADTLAPMVDYGEGAMLVCFVQHQLPRTRTSVGPAQFLVACASKSPTVRLWLYPHHVTADYRSLRIHEDSEPFVGCGEQSEPHQSRYLPGRTQYARIIARTMRCACGLPGPTRP